MAYRIVVTDVGERSGLAAVRCLARAGYEVTALASSRLAPGLWSGLARSRHITIDGGENVGGYIDAIERIVTRQPHDLLLASTDISLWAVSEHRDRLEPHVRLGIPSHELVVDALDREQLAIAADAVGLGNPDTYVCDTAADAVAAAAEYGYPVLVKPVSTVVQRGESLVRRGSELAVDADAVREAVARFGRVIVQRRIDGDVVSVAGVATSDGVIGFVACRYLRTWPPKAGSAAFSVTIELEPELIEQISALLARMGWTGLFEVELIVSADGAYTAIDLNPRIHGWMSLAVAAGVPLPALWCGWRLGTPPDDVPVARAGVHYRWEEGDLRNLISRWRGGSGDRSFAGFLPRCRAAHPLFEVNDPAPLLARLLQVGGLASDRAVARIGGRLNGRARPVESRPETVLSPLGAAGRRGGGAVVGSDDESHHWPEAERRRRSDEM